jgi:hypothetical protein
MSLTPTPSAEPAVPVTSGATPPEGRGWTAGRIVALVAGCVLGLVSLGLLAGGGWATWETNTQRDRAGYLTASPHALTTNGNAITSKGVADLANGPYSSWLGTARVRVTPTDRAAQVFIGVGPTAAVNSYLGGVNHTVVTDWFPVTTDQVIASGATPRVAPSDTHIWSAHTVGSGRQTLTWKPASGTTVVVMNADAHAGLTATADIGATVPDLVWLAVVLFIAGGLLLAASVALVAVPVTRASK